MGFTTANETPMFLNGEKVDNFEIVFEQQEIETTMLCDNIKSYKPGQSIINVNIKNENALNEICNKCGAPKHKIKNCSYCGS